MSSSAAGGGGGGGGSGGGGYGEKTYWDSRYAQEERYDWYLSYPQFKEQLIPHLRVQDCGAADPSSPLRPRSSLRCLIVGCGNSELSASMVDDGFTQLESVDYSAVVIDKMREQHRQRPDIRFSVMDVRDMSSFPDKAFDAIIDKSALHLPLLTTDAQLHTAHACAPPLSVLCSLPSAAAHRGTLDAILCGQESSRHAAAMLSECHRLLADDDGDEQEGGGGVLVVITYGQPTSRLSYLEQSRYSWHVTYELLGGTRYMYVMTKRRRTPSKIAAESGA